jgi:ATP-dependent exoDNAse (exonuclease V) alpha subunit
VRPCGQNQKRQPRGNLPPQRQGSISRSAGRSATAAAAYRAGCKITDERTGEIHDYTRKGGVESADIVLPDGAPEWATDRAKLWNAAELAEKRKDACVAREFEVALPSELSPAERRRLALDFAKDMANREGCAVDVAIHAPGKEGDNRNHHAHILRTTRKVDADGLGAKLDTEKAGRKRSDDFEAVRATLGRPDERAATRKRHSRPRRSPQP